MKNKRYSLILGIQLGNLHFTRQSVFYSASFETENKTQKHNKQHTHTYTHTHIHTYTHKHTRCFEIESTTMTKTMFYYTPHGNV